jgi:hypothetical protein
VPALPSAAQEVRDDIKTGTASKSFASCTVLSMLRAYAAWTDGATKSDALARALPRVDDRTPSRCLTELHHVFARRPVL